MTCTSERSGIASNGVFFKAQRPQAPRKKTIRKTTNLFFALPSMILSIIVFGLWRMARFALWRMAYGLWHMAYGLARGLDFCQKSLSQCCLEGVDSLAEQFAFSLDLI